MVNDEVWFNGFTRWEDVWSLLQSDDWFALRDDRQGLEVHYGVDGLVVYEWAGERMRARHRRGLHRLGFRADPGRHVTFWEWNVGSTLATTTHSEHDEMLERFAHYARPETAAALRRRLVGGALIMEHAKRVVHDVFRTEVGDLAVAVHREPEYWDEEGDDESWPLPSP